MPKTSAPELRQKLYRCLKIAVSDQKLSCHVGEIVDAYAEAMKNPDYHNPAVEAWVNYYLKRNEPKPTGAYQLRLTCPRCGDSHWIKRDDSWECAACGEFSYPEDMCTEAVDA